MKKLKEEKELKKLIFSEYAISPHCELAEDIRASITALVNAVEDRCAETIKECRGIPFDRIDTGGRKWIHAPADVVAAAIQTGRKK